MSEERLTKVYIDLPKHWATGGESLWAEDLGEDLYRIRNVPFFAYGLNFYDIVKATSVSADLKPEVKEIVKPSGHKTLRVFFEGDVKESRQVDLLDQLKRYKAYYERATARHVAIDIEPEGDYRAVYDQLDVWERDGVLDFESCEVREAGSFDDVADEA